MLRRLVFGIGLLSATVSSHAVLAADPHAMQIVVSLNKQSLAVYEDGKVTATSRISSGKAGHETPTGIFSILEKEKYHESNIYSNAPMPWMERITWSGIALHQGVVPNHPASHGCVRMPAAFAVSLYQQTVPGVHVIISDEPVVPQPIDDVALFKPRKAGPGPMMTDVSLRTSSISNGSAKRDHSPAKTDSADDAADDVSKADSTGPDDAKLMPVSASPSDSVTAVASTDGGSTDAAPAGLNGAATTAAPDIKPAALRILITRRGDREQMIDAQQMLQDLGFETGGQDGFAGPLTRTAIAGFKRWKNISTKGPLMSADFIDALYKADGREKPPAGQIMVRRDFQPVFEAPVGIKDPDVALGTHFLIADHTDRNTETADWFGLTLSNKLSDETMKRLGISIDDDQTMSGDAKAALDRIEIPDDVREKIETAMGDGTSITINDEGLGPETAKSGTDFITLTHPEPEVASLDGDNGDIQPVSADADGDAASQPARRSSIKRYHGMVGLY